jgi:hypothetical protein
MKDLLISRESLENSTDKLFGAERSPFKNDFSRVCNLRLIITVRQYQGSEIFLLDLARRLLIGSTDEFCS